MILLYTMCFKKNPFHLINDKKTHDEKLKHII